MLLLSPFEQDEQSELVWAALRVQAAALEILPDVLLVLVPLLLSELSHFVLQLDDGPLDLVVLADQRYPAVGSGHRREYRGKSCCTVTTSCKISRRHTLTPALAVWLLLPTDRSYAASSSLEFASCAPTSRKLVTQTVIHPSWSWNTASLPHLNFWSSFWAISIMKARLLKDEGWGVVSSQSHKLHRT